jgi:hypothetical protein
MASTPSSQTPTKSVAADLIKQTNILLQTLLNFFNVPIIVTDDRGNGLRTAQVNISNSQTPSQQIVLENLKRRSLIILNTGTQNCYIGELGVSTATGFLIKPNTALTLDKSQGALYGISDNSAGTTLNIIEE